MSELDDILGKIYVEVPELPNKVIGLSRNMIADLKVALLQLVSGAEVESILIRYRNKCMNDYGRLKVEVKNPKHAPSEWQSNYEQHLERFAFEAIQELKAIIGLDIEDMKSISKYDLSEQHKLRRYNQHHSPGISSDTKFDNLGVDGDYDGS